MSAKDIVHEIVREALEKDGWVITHDPLFLRVSENIGMFLNLAANKVIIAYFDERTTSGVVEGINNKLKLIKRRAYGMRNFTNFKLRSFLTWHFTI